MDSKTILFNACNAVARQLEGFEIYKKGQRLKKISADKDIFFEIAFETSFINHSSHIMMVPNIAVYSKKLKKWQTEHTTAEVCTGLIYANHLGYITPLQTWKRWNLAGLSYEKSVDEITRNIQKYALPIFDLFNSKENAIEFLRNNGTKFNSYTEDSLGPLDFLLCFADRDTSEVFFNNFIKNFGYKGKVIDLYDQLVSEKEIDLNYSEFVGASQVKLAYINGISIHH